MQGFRTKTFLLLSGVLVVVGVFAYVVNAEAGDAYHNIGAGFGIPFGFLGVNYELEMDVSESLSMSPTAAVGHTIFAGLGWNVGVQTSFLSQDSKWRPGFSVWYGTNTIVETWDDYESETGLTLGVGIKYRSRPTSKGAWVLHLLYPFNDIGEDGGYEEYGAPVKIAFGYSRRF